MLPGVKLDLDPQLRWFRPGGCVQQHADGSCWVYVGGNLIGRYTQGSPALRDVLIVLVMEDRRARPGEVARAFDVSTETVRRARARAKKDGLAALLQGRKRGAPSKRTPRLRRRVYRLFEQQQSVSAVQRALKGKLSWSTLRSMREEWARDRERASDEVGQAGAEDLKQQLPLPAAAANDTSVVATEAQVVEMAQECAAEPGQSEAVNAPEAQQEAELAAQEARSELSLEEAAARIPGRTVQHAGTWIMLAMLQTLGLYAAARAACSGAVSPVALRVALDAVAMALSLGQRCVEGVRWLATSSAALLLRSRGAISASWTRRVLKEFAKQGSDTLHLQMARTYLRRARRDDGRIPLYLDNHPRPYTGQHTIRKGWRMQDKRARPGNTDFYVHDEEGRPLFRIAVPSHDSLTAYLQPIAGFVSSVFDDQVTPLLAFDRAGAFPAPLAALRDEGVEFTTYERAPYPQLTAAAFERSVTLLREAKPHEPLVIQFTDERRKNLGKGRGRVGRIALRMPDGQQVNILTASTLPAEELIRIQLRRWGCQENQFKHGNERWAINQLDGRRVEPYPPDAVIPNPARSRLERELRLLRVAEGVTRNKLARLAADDPKRAKLEQDLQRALAQQRELEALRPWVPTHAPVRETEVADELMYHPGEYKTVIDTLRIALANAESDLATWLAPHLRNPREAKKTLATLLAAPGVVQLGARTVKVTLAPAGTARDQAGFAALLDRVNAIKPTLPGDPSGRRLLFKVQT
jgi:transposase